MFDNASVTTSEVRAGELPAENQRLREELSRMHAWASRMDSNEEQRPLEARRFHAAPANNRSGIMLLDPAGIVLELIHGIYGFPHSRLVGRQVFEFMPAEVAGRFRADLESVARNPGAEACSEYCVVDASGAERWLDCVMTDRLEDPAIQAIVVDYRDITDAKLAGERLALLESIVESPEWAVVSQDLAGRILSWSPGAVELYGYTAEEMIGNQTGVLLAPGQPDDEPAARQCIGAGGSLRSYPTARLRKDGSRADIRLTIAPLRDQRQRLAGDSHIAVPRAPAGGAGEKMESAAETFLESRPLPSRNQAKPIGW